MASKILSGLRAGQAQFVGIQEQNLLSPLVWSIKLPRFIKLQARAVIQCCEFK